MLTTSFGKISFISEGTFFEVLADSTMKGLLFLAVAWVMTSFMTRASASTRHYVWLLAISGVLCLPFLSVTLPNWHVLPHWRDSDLDNQSKLISEADDPETQMSVAQNRSFEPISDWGHEGVAHVSKDTSQIETGVTSTEFTATKDIQKRKVNRLANGSLRTMVIVAWGLGFCVVCAMAVLSRMSLFLLARRSQHVTSGPLRDLLNEACHQLDIRRRVILLQSSERSMPFTWGCISPRLLLPQEASGWSWELSRAVLLHETAHIKRLDYLTQLLSQVACMIYWFHPVVWFAARKIAAERESASDDMVLSCGLKGSDYAEHLLSVGAGLASKTGRAFAAVGMARKSQIEGRILSVLDSGRNRAVLSRGLLFMGIVVLCCVSVPVAMLETTVQGKEQKKEKGIAKQKSGSELQKGQGRLLRFPADKAVGIVYTRPRRADGYDIGNTYDNWKRLGVARGDVRVPADVDVRLEIATDSSTNLSFLDKLKSDAIQTMMLRSTKVGDSGLEHIGRLTGLKDLDLRNTKITDKGIQHLKSLANLEHISLDGYLVKEQGFGVGDDGLAVLSNLPSLKGLSLIRSNVTDKGVAHLVGNKSLLVLSLSGNNITNEGLVHLKDLSGLEYLGLGGAYRKKSKINDKGLQHLAMLTRLKSLGLSFTEITDEGLKHLRNFPRLEKLDLEDTNVTNAGLIHLQPLKSLKNVRLYGLGLNDEGVKHLSKVQSLQKIAANLSITNEGLGHLSKLTKLESLSLGSKEISDLGMQHIAKMKSLKTLWFQSCSITDAGLEQLVGLNSLEMLMLRGTKVTDEGLRHVTKFPSLKILSIEFGENVLSEERPAFRHLEFLRGLTSLKIGGKGLRMDDLIEIAEISGLERLEIRDLVLDDVGIGYLSELTSLKELSLDKTTTMTDEGIQELANMRKLEYLAFSAPVTDESLAHLKNLKFLKYLQIGSPYITEKGIANLEKHLPGLRKVNRLKWRPLQ